MKKHASKTYMIVIGAIGVLFYCLNSFVPYYDDDVWYAFRYIPQETLSPLHNMADVMVSQYHHYLGENSRALVHIVLQLLMGWLPAWAFDVLNSAVFLLFMVLIVRYTMQSNYRKEPLSYLLAGVAVFTLLPCRDYLFYWAAGALNYLWTSVAIILFLLLWRNLRNGSNASARYAPMWVIVSFLCGFSHEAVALPIGVVLLVWMLVHYRCIGNNRLTYCAIAFGLGCLLLLLAPSVSTRLSHATPQESGYDYTAYFYKLQQLVAVPLFIFLLVVTSCIRSCRRKVVTFISDNSILCSIALVALLFALLVGAQAPTIRPFYAAEFYAMLLILRYYNAILRPVMERYLRWTTIAVATLCVGWMAAVLPAANQVGKTHHRLFTDYEKSADGIVYLDTDTVSPIAAPWVMNLRSYYLTVDEASPWRGFVIPLHTLRDDTMCIPTPLLAQDNIGQYELYHAYIHILPAELRPVIETPAQFFVSARKVPGDSPFYKASSEYMITPLDSLSVGDSWQWEYHAVSWRDNAASTIGRLRRLLTPQSFPATEDVLWCDTILLPDGRQYVNVKLPEYRQVRAVVRK